MKTKLSHSQCGRFQMCGESYRLHYKEKIRPTVFSAALAMGTAIDEAMNVLLTKPDQNAEDAFEKSFTEQYVNKVLTHLPDCLDLVYADADFDGELLTEKDFKSIEMPPEEALGIFSKIKACKKEKGFENLSEDDKLLYNYMNWLSLKNKGLLMIKAYRKKILPRIEKVHEVQRYVELTNADGDKVIGYVDLIADIRGVGTVILDHKTSASEYEEDAVLTSPQLSLYTHILEEEYNTRKAGYIVFRKSVIKNRTKICSVCGHNGTGKQHTTCNNEVDGKRCKGAWNETIDPDIFIQFLMAEIPEQTEKIVLENYDEINKAIKAEHFSRNFSSCNNWYGGKCPYIGLCYKGSMKGLVKV